MSKAFYAAEDFNRDLSGWNTGKVQEMDFMFAFTKHEEASSMNRLTSRYGVGGWDVSSVKYFTGMFEFNDYFNEDLSGWNTKEAVSMADMFNSAGWADGRGINQDLSSWNVTKVEHFDNFLCLANTFSESNKEKLCDVNVAHKSWLSNFCDSGIGWSNFPADPCA